MLPAHVSVILLSATVANVNDFAEWVGNTKRKKVLWRLLFIPQYERIYKIYMSGIRHTF